MHTLKFKTNINCGGCVKAVTLTLNQEIGAGNWQVDTASPDKTLTVSCTLPQQQVVALVEEAGFRAEPVG